MATQLSQLSKLVQKIVWYKRGATTHTSTDIHMVLNHGTLQDIKLLKNEVPLQQLQEIFATKPEKIYTPAGFNFVKNFVLQITQNLDADRYLKTTSRSIG